MARKLNGEALAAMPAAERKQLIAALAPIDAASLLYDWKFWARPNQLIPKGEWRFWLLRAGRGFGKTRTGAETVRAWKDDGFGLFVLGGRTAGDLRDLMIEGPAGILVTSPPWDRPKYEPSKRRLTWLNGATAVLRSADEPDSFKGINAEKAWLDELSSWPYPRAFAEFNLGLRLGSAPQAVITTTPRPNKLTLDLVNRVGTKAVVETRGSTYDNRDNLAAGIYEEIVSEYEGTMIGRQEVHGEIVRDFPAQIYRSFDATTMVIDDMPTFERVFACLDWGSTNPTAFYLIGITGNVAVVFGEQYVVGETSDAKYDAISKACGEHDARPLYVDPSAAQVILDLQHRGVPATGADNAVVDGIRRVQGLMETDRLRVDRTCYNLLDEFGSYSWREDRRGNVIEQPVKIHDHGCDAVRYGLFTFGEWSRPTPSRTRSRSNRDEDRRAGIANRSW